MPKPRLIPSRVAFYRQRRLLARLRDTQSNAVGVFRLLDAGKQLESVLDQERGNVCLRGSYDRQRKTDIVDERELRTHWKDRYQIESSPSCIVGCHPRVSQ